MEKNPQKLLSGLDADRILSESIPAWVKFFFLLTNLPYWMIAIYSGYDWIYYQLSGHFPDDVHICGRPEMYAIGGFLVALSSTVMHAAQLRLGSYLCCCAHPSRTEQFHETSMQKIFKKVDIFCAISALLTCVFCKHWDDVVAVFMIALPLFVAGIVLKRVSWHYSYIVVHGSWHIVTSLLVWDAVFK